jgi:hypothetical protein
VSTKKGHILVDFDGTLAVWRGNYDVLGPPILPMIRRVQEWLRKGYEVKIFTARVSHKDEVKNEVVRDVLRGWCESHIGKQLEVTNVKDFNCIEIWDDKAVTVIKDTGMSWRDRMVRR